MYMGKTRLTLVFSCLFLISCNYRVFDLAQYPELGGILRDSPFSSKVTEENFRSIFQTIIQPKCLGCHKPGGKADEILFDDYETLMSAVTEEGEPLIVPGKPEESLFYTAMLPTSKRMMPPRKSGIGAVEPERADVIRAWITSGAPEEIIKKL